MSKASLSLSLFLLTSLWGSVGYAAGRSAASGMTTEPSGNDLFNFVLAIGFTVAFGVAVWRNISTDDGSGK